MAVLFALQDALEEHQENPFLLGVALGAAFERERAREKERGPEAQDERA